MRNVVIAMHIAAVIAMPFIAAAQQGSGENIVPGSYSRQDTHPNVNPLKNAAKTTATDVRLVAMINLAYDDTNYVPYDSTAFSYSGSRGGVFDDLKIGWKWKADIVSIYDGYLVTGTFSPAYKTSFIYDANDKETTHTWQSWNTSTSAWGNRSKTTFSYDASNNVVMEVIEMWNPITSVWYNAIRRTNTYTPTNKVATNMQEVWSTTSGTWGYTDKTTYVWDANDNIYMDFREEWTTGWENVGRTRYSYDALGNRIGQVSEYWSLGAWHPSSKIVNSNFIANHQPQTIIQMEWNETTATFDNIKKDNYTYNSYDKPTFRYDELWDVVSGTWQVSAFTQATRYYYEPYTPTSVDNPIAHDADVEIYPVPTSDKLTINATWTGATPVSVAIVDMSGKVFMTWSVPPRKQYEETFSVSELPAGNYVITLHGSNGKVSKQFMVVR